MDREKNRGISKNMSIFQRNIEETSFVCVIIEVLSTKLFSKSQQIQIIRAAFTIVYFESRVLVKNLPFQFCPKALLERKVSPGAVRSSFFGGD